MNANHNSVIQGNQNVGGTNVEYRFRVTRCFHMLHGKFSLIRFIRMYMIPLRSELLDLVFRERICSRADILRW